MDVYNCVAAVAINDNSCSYITDRCRIRFDGGPTINLLDHITHANSGIDRGSLVCKARDDQVAAARMQAKQSSSALVDRLNRCSKGVVETK